VNPALTAPAGTLSPCSAPSPLNCCLTGSQSARRLAPKRSASPCRRPCPIPSWLRYCRIARSAPPSLRLSCLCRSADHRSSRGRRVAGDRQLPRRRPRGGRIELHIQSIGSTSSYRDGKVARTNNRERLSSQIELRNLDRCRTLIQERDCGAGRLTDGHSAKVDAAGLRKKASRIRPVHNKGTATRQGKSENTCQYNWS
jgi:hypothetical protein